MPHSEHALLPVTCPMHADGMARRHQGCNLSVLATLALKA